MGFEAEAISLERYRAAACKRVEDWWQLSSTVLEHLGASLCIDLRMVVKLLPHHPANDLEEPLALGVLSNFCRPLVGMGAGIVHHGREKDRPRGGQRQPRPPMVYALRMRPNSRHLVIG